MEYLGNRELFSSHFVIGMAQPKNYDIDEFNILMKWMKFKDNDWAMGKYRTHKTQYIEFLTIVELDHLKSIVEDFQSIYKRRYPFGVKKDFIEYFFGYSIYHLEKFIEDDFFNYGHTDKDYKFYFRNTKRSTEVIDTIIPANYDIEYFKQYYQCLLNFFNDFDYDKKSYKIKFASSSRSNISDNQELIFDFKGKQNTFYKIVKDEIEEDGYLDAKTDTGKVKIYNIGLLMFFLSNKLTLRRRISKEEIEIETQEYFQSYVDGYRKGEQYFESECKVSSSVIYGLHGKQYVDDLLYKYFEAILPNKEIGWHFVKKEPVRFISQKIIEDFGYYSGVVNKLEEFITQYPEQFKSFNKSFYKDRENPKEVKIEKREDELSVSTNEKIIRKELRYLKEIDNRKNLVRLPKEQDFDNLVQWIKYFFDNNFELPKIEKPIETLNTSQQNIVTSFKTIWDKIRGNSHNRDEKLFQLITICFVQYQKKELSNLQKTKKSPEYDRITSFDE